MRERVEKIVLGLTALFSIVVALLDWLKLLSLPTGTLPSLTLLGVGLITGYIVLERSRIENIESKLTEGTNQVIRSLDGVKVTRFSNEKDIYEYVAKRTSEARKTIDDMSFGEIGSEVTVAGQEAYEKYIKSIAAACAKKTLTYREIMKFPAFFDRAETMLEKKLVNYLLAYYPSKVARNFPIVQFMVIDSEEVVFGFYQLPSEDRSRKSIQLAVTHPDLVALFQDYYKTIWNNAKQINDLSDLQEIRRTW